MVELPERVYPSSNWGGYLRCFHGSFDLADTNTSRRDPPGLVVHVKQPWLARRSPAALNAIAGRIKYLRWPH